MSYDKEADLTDHKTEWASTKERLVNEIAGLGMPGELGELIARL